MALATPSVVKIIPVAQNYAWGKIGNSSAVAQVHKIKFVKIFN